MICSILCVFAYIVIVSNELTNTYDGLWQGSYYAGYSWVLSIGRWFWPVVGIVMICNYLTKRYILNKRNNKTSTPEEKDYKYERKYEIKKHE